MPKERINLRVSDLTLRQLEELQARWNTSKTETITTIIDRVYREEHTMSRNEYKYYAVATNDEGHRLDIVLSMSERRHSIQAFEDAARQQVSSGWVVHIMRSKFETERNGGGYLGTEEVKTFTV